MVTYFMSTLWSYLSFVIHITLHVIVPIMQYNWCVLGCWISNASCVIFYKLYFIMYDDFNWNVFYASLLAYVLTVMAK